MDRGTIGFHVHTENFNFGHNSIIGKKSLTWRRIEREEVSRYLDLLTTARQFCEEHDVDASSFRFLDLSYEELCDFTPKDASEVFERNLLQLTANTLSVLKAVSVQNNYWFEINLQKPSPKIHLFYEVKWDTGRPVVVRSKKLTEKCDPYYENALKLLLEVYGRVLNKQKQRK